MKPVTLHYPDGTLRHYQLPTSFLDLTPEQYILSVATLQEAEKRPEAQWLLLPLLLGVTMEDLNDLNDVQRVILLSKLTWLTDTQAMPYQCLIPSFHVADYLRKVKLKKPSRLLRSFSHRLYGPGDGLKHLTFGEFIAAEQRFEQYLKNPTNQVAASTAALDEFCGILYRKTRADRKYHEDHRVPYEKGQVKHYGEFFGPVREVVKIAILQNYCGAKAYFPRLYKHVFPKQDNQERAPGAAAPPKSSSLAWLDAAIEMAGRDITKIRDIENSNLHLVLKVLDTAIEQNKKLKEELRQKR